MLGELFSIYFLNTTIIFYTQKYIFHLRKVYSAVVYAQAM